MVIIAALPERTDLDPWLVFFRQALIRFVLIFVVFLVPRITVLDPQDRTLRSLNGSVLYVNRIKSKNDCVCNQGKINKLQASLNVRTAQVTLHNRGSGAGFLFFLVSASQR